MKKLNNILIIVITSISYIIALTYLKDKQYVDLLKIVLILPVMLIPKILNKFNIKITCNLEFSYLLFITFAYFLGVILNFYDKINSYDTIMHFISGIFTGYIATYLLKDKNDNGEVLEDGTIIEPYLTGVIYIGKQITTLEQCQELYEEIEVK